MTDFDYLEQQGQTNIFDFLDITPTSPRNRAFEIGDSVQVRYYVDEIEYVQRCHPHLLQMGIIVDKQHDFYLVKFDYETVSVQGEKLSLWREK